MKLNEQISQLRKERKMSQEELSESIGISRQAISKWETGQSNPDTENLIRLAEIFQVDVNTLIRENAEETDLSSQHIPKPGVPVAIVWLLSILLIIAIGASILFACLWQQQVQFRIAAETTSPNTETVTTGYDYIELYFGQLQEEIPLTPQEKTNLIRYLTLFHHTPIDNATSSDPTDGERVYIVKFGHHGVHYEYYYSQSQFCHTITYSDGERKQYFYAVDYVLLYELDRYAY